MTASALEEDRVIILSEGCDAYIRKPFHEDELFEALRVHLGVKFIYEQLQPEEKDIDVESELAGELTSFEYKLSKNEYS